MGSENIHVSYIKKALIKEISEKLQSEHIIGVDIKHAENLDGFMSALYMLSIQTINENSEEKSYELIAKFMKGDERFRLASRSYTQFANEIFVYTKVIPYFSKVLQQSGACAIKTEDWIPEVFVAKYGHIEGLCENENTSNESVLVVENLKPKNYSICPNLYLDRHHMLTIINPLASYHAMTYVLKIRKDSHLNDLINQILPLPFSEKNNKNHFYDILYSLAFIRFFEYFERSKSILITKNKVEDQLLEGAIYKLKELHGKKPTELLERIRSINDQDDQKFATILHGDFNRNNVLLRYTIENNIPKDAKLIDFQEVRYSTPCIDLSFVMYMNMDPSIRDGFWMEFLQYYHNQLFMTMSSVLQGSDDEALAGLNTYSFEEFYRHFSKKAFYGVMVCMHFLPWLCATKEELKSLSNWFERDMQSEEFRKISLEAAGDSANKKIFDIIKHAHIMGYMDFI